VYQKSDEIFSKKVSSINEVRQQVLTPGQQRFGGQSMIIQRRIFLNSEEAQATDANNFTNMDDLDFVYSRDFGHFEDDDNNSSNSSVDFTPLQSQSRGLDAFGDQIGLARNSIADIERQFGSNNLMLSGLQSTKKVTAYKKV